MMKKMRKKIWTTEHCVDEVARHGPTFTLGSRRRGSLVLQRAVATELLVVLHHKRIPVPVGFGPDPLPEPATFEWRGGDRTGRRV